MRVLPHEILFMNPDAPAVGENILLMSKRKCSLEAVRLALMPVPDNLKTVGLAGHTCASRDLGDRGDGRASETAVNLEIRATTQTVELINCAMPQSGGHARAVCAKPLGTGRDPTRQ